MNLDELAKRQVAKLEGERTRNRALAMEHIPEFVKLFDDLKAMGMEPRMVQLNVEHKEAA